MMARRRDASESELERFEETFPAPLTSTMDSRFDALSDRAQEESTSLGRVEMLALVLAGIGAAVLIF